MFRKKKTIAMFLIIIMSIVLNSSVLFAESNEAAEELYIMDKNPGILWNDITLLPMRPFLEGLGLNVEWVNDKKLILASGGFGKATVNKYKEDDGTIHWTRYMKKNIHSSSR